MGQHAFDGPEIVGLAIHRDIGPRPVDTAMMGMIFGEIIGDDNPIWRVHRMQVTASCAVGRDALLQHHAVVVDKDRRPVLIEFH